MATLTADIGATNVHAQLDERLEPLHLHSLQGRLSLLSETPSAWSFSASQIVFITDRGHRFGPSNITADCSVDERHLPTACRFGANSIDIGSLSAISKTVPLPPDLTAFLVDHPLSGLIRNLSIEVQDDFKAPENWRFDLAFDRLTLPVGSDVIPGFRNLAGSVRSRGNGIYDLQLQSHISSLIFPGIFDQERMNFDVLTANVTFRAQPQFSVEIHHAYAENRDAALTARGNWQATGGAGTIDLHGELLRAKATAVPKYLPEVLGHDILKYLRSAILSGHASGGRWILRGNLDDFPWAGPHADKGHFLIEANVENGAYDFLPNIGIHSNQGSLWPILENINATLTFEGDGMRITGHNTRSAGLEATNVSVRIPHYKNAELFISGDISGDLSNGLQYLRHGVMIHDIVGNAFDQSSGSGPVAAKLDLRIPLAHPEDLRLTLDLAFRNNHFAFGHKLPEIDGLSGTLRITENGIETSETLRGQTEAGSLISTAELQNHQLKIGFQGSISPNDILKIIDEPAASPFFAKIQGNSTFTAEAQVDLLKHELLISGRTSLKGISSALPVPLTKAAEETWPLAFSFMMPLENPDDSNLRISLHERGNAEIVFDNHRSLKRAGIGLGRAASTPRQGIAISVTSPTLSVTQWSSLLSDAVETAEIVRNMSDQTNDAASSAEITQFDIDSDIVEVLGRPLHNVTATLRAVGRDRHLRINAAEVKGQIEFFEHRNNRPNCWSIKLTQLHVPEAVRADMSTAISKTSESTERFDLPDLDVIIDDLRFGNMLIGKIELAARTDIDKHTWKIESLTVRNPGGTLTANGGWAQAEDKTSLYARATIRSTGDLLHSLDIRDVVHDAPGTLSLSLEWPGQPHKFATDALSGHIEAHADKGQLLQIEPGAGRLLSLLSMQHLLRRLTLDFSDVVSKGLVFDRVDLNADIKSGILTTPQTTIMSSAASILISGTVDLHRESLDLRAIVLPSLNAEGASLALAVANPIVGLSTFVAQLALKDRLNAFFSQEYQVKGSFDNPIIEKLEKTNR